MFFDRYEIHIQAFGDFIYAKWIIFRSSFSQNMIENEVLNFQKMINNVGLGGLDTSKNPQIMEFGVSGL